MSVYIALTKRRNSQLREKDQSMVWLVDKEDGDTQLCHRLCHARIQKVLSEGVLLFFSLMRGGRIQIPLLAGHQRPTNRRWWPNIEGWLDSFVIFRASRKPYIFVIFQGKSGPPAPPPPLWIRTCTGSVIPQAWKLILWLQGWNSTRKRYQWSLLESKLISRQQKIRMKYHALFVNLKKQQNF